MNAAPGDRNDEPKPGGSGVSRRRFMATAGGTAAAAVVTSRSLRAEPAIDRIRVAVIGLSRGMAHVNTFAALPNVEIAAVCDVDRDRLAAGAKEAAAKQGSAPRAEPDLRRILEDPGIDAVSIALPNHWHAPATILACRAGKHVYVEKPGSHNPHEAMLMVEAARHHDRRVQMGNQRRSLPLIIEAIERLRDGVIGPVRTARCWYDAERKSIGRGQPAPVPDHLDYALWQGPAPERPYKDNLIHYNWHWHWHWGNGELGNNGVHALDIARWGLGVDFPLRATCTGGRYHFDDDQETPDTADATFDFGGCSASWYGSSCLPRKNEQHAFVAFYGDGGTLAIEGAGYRIFDLEGRETENKSGPFADTHHFGNFADAIRQGTPLNAGIADAQVSTMLCHLGNIAYRSGTMVHFDPAARKLAHATPEQAALWKRDYRDGWEPGV